MEKKMLRFKIKEEISEEQRAKIDAHMKKISRAVIVADKSKNDKGRWVVKLKKPELFTADAVALIFKKAKVTKMLRKVEISDSGDGEGD